MRFLKPAQKGPSQVIVPEFRFVGEQDGPPERLLKEEFTYLFRRERNVSRAYLARVEYGNRKRINVVLGLRTQLDCDENIVRDMGTIFASIFDAKEHLDVMFLTAAQEFELSRVCKPFFEQTDP